MDKVEIKVVPQSNGLVDNKYSFSVYRSPITNIFPFRVDSLHDVYTVIISDKYKERTLKLRAIADKTAKDKFKIFNLDYVTFSGVFNKRSTDDLVQHSSLFCVDLDHLIRLVEIKEKIIDILPPSLIFVSPSGTGLKLVYKINVEQAEHIQYYRAFETFFNMEFSIAIDEKCKDIPRACFLCYDSEAYFNQEAVEMDISFINTFCIEMKPTQQEIIRDHSLIMERLVSWLNKIESFSSGNRNNYITRLARAYNRFGIPQVIAESKLLSYAMSDFTEKEIIATIKSTYKNTQFHNVAKFDMNTPYEFIEIESSKEEKTATPLLPIDGFPDFIQNFINEYYNVYKTPQDYIAASVLFSTALAIGDKLELVTKYKNVPIFWLAIVGDVSCGKTDPLNACLSYFNKCDSTEFKNYSNEKALFDAESEKQKKDRDTSIQRPQYFQYILNDYTPEALAKVHSINNRGLCIYRDELKGWLDDFDRYNKNGEQSNMLSSFVRLTAKFNRAGSEPILIENPCIYVAGGLQPDLLYKLAGDLRAENGFMSRLIFAYPDLHQKQGYNKAKLNPESLSNYHKYLSVLTGLNEVTNLTLSYAAESTYANWYNSNAEKINNEKNGYLRGAYGKLDIYSLRIAIVIHGMEIACNQITNSEISERTMLFAIELTEYFRLTALKVFNQIHGKNAHANLNKKDVAKYCSSFGASQNEIAKVLKVSQQYVQKILK